MFSNRVSVSLDIYLSVHLAEISICVSIYVFICVCICLSMHISVCSSIVFICLVHFLSQASVEGAFLALVHELQLEAVPIITRLINSIEGNASC